MPNDTHPYHDSVVTLLDDLSEVETYDAALYCVLKFVTSTKIPEEHEKAAAKKIAYGIKQLTGHMIDVDARLTALRDSSELSKKITNEVAITEWDEDRMVECWKAMLF